MTDSRSPEQTPRPPEPGPSGVQGNQTQEPGTPAPSRRQESTRNLPEDRPAPRAASLPRGPSSGGSIARR